MLSESSFQCSSAALGSAGARSLYKRLLESPPDQAGVDESRAFLEEQLRRASDLPCDIPEDVRQLSSWVERKTAEAGSAYQRYLDARNAGAPRRYFRSKAHALGFLQGVAPTKLVDGAWLYGTLEHWQDLRFRPLIRTYLEELGDGDPARNHVVLYQQLLAEQGCDILPAMSDEYYVQGALQLALAHNAPDFLPELIGYNLGYEQLPLHLLISAYELAELDIDPYYFTLHVTIDNASTGHARKAIQSVADCRPRTGDSRVYLQRIANGYRLNDLGYGSTDVIANFDLELALVESLERKSQFGKLVHSDFCTIGGRTVNEWLSSPTNVRTFLSALQAEGWIKRNEDPRRSRFWRLTEGPRALMAGVFSPFEQQLLYDWIAGNWSRCDALGEAQHGSHSQSRKHRRVRQPRFRFSSRELPMPSGHSRPGDLDQDIEALARELRGLAETSRMQRLIPLMAPGEHASALGLFATRQFAIAVR